MTTAAVHSHRLLVYRDAAEFERGVTPFVLEAMGEGRRVLMAVAPAHQHVMREALGPRIHGVVLTDAHAFSRRQGPMFGELARFAAGGVGEAPAAVVSEVPLRDFHTSAVEAHFRLEAACTSLYAGHGVTGICAYAADDLENGLLERVRCVHPELLDGAGVRVSDTFVEPGRFLRGAVARPPGRPGRAVALHGAADLARLRSAVRECATRRAVDAAELEDFLVAVSEIATNALLHAVAPRRASLWADEEELVCCIGDSGPGLPDPLAAHLPPVLTGAAGHGLWLATTLTDVIEFASDETGTVVIMRLRLGA
ncbi:MAG: ATP-binding protein [Thermoleophilia bacterium]